ncbi:ABC transporter permease (plasmid) [Halostagnicola larsenii XH-48]|uniref:ABC transporter permease n=1 Tax=Halostagnicola larsenii XH-48 TaxID=797299 RepID=W0JX99_9EURY|nr:ABC transporter permease [Halostagnicola larsenii]AHG01830.1 ABC transporter permease [Halostagnicola larsenii XH-48]
MNSNYFLKRVGQAVLTFVATVTLTFVLYRMMPGGPAQALENVILQQQSSGGNTIDPERIELLVSQYTNLESDAPLYEQYYQYMHSVFIEQDLGESLYSNDTVTHLLAERIPWSMLISVYAMVIGYTVSIVLGAMMAFKEKSRFDSISSVVLIGLNSTPYYVVGVLLIFFFSIRYEFFPRGGRVGLGIDPGFNLAFMQSIAYHAMLPVFSMSVLGLGTALTMRGNSVRVLGEDYLRVAKLRGLRNSRIATQYVGRNAILPMYTQFMIGIAGVLSSSVIVEEIFTYPGVGLLVYDAIQVRNYPVLMGSLIVFTLITVIAILIADLTYGFVDPRISTGGDNE